MDQVTGELQNGGGASDWLRNNAVKIIVVVFWIGIVTAVIIYQRSTGLTPYELAVNLTDRLTVYLAERWYGPIVYIAIYFLRPVILFPASVLTILAGNLYGLGFGLCWGLIAGTSSSIIPYFAGRWLFGQKRLTEESEAGATGRLARFTSLLRNHPFQTVLTMRLLFLPYDPVSILAGSIRVPFLQFITATLIGNVVGSFPYIALGATVQGNPFTAEIEFNWWILAVAAATWVVSIGVSRFINRRQEAVSEQPT